MFPPQGLGKTIEVIALIGANGVPRPPLNELTAHEGYLRHKSATTLILVPPSLVGQWVDEIENRHAGRLRVYKFYGSARPSNPLELLNYDIVLTTFQVMVTEMKTPNSVLDLVHWHRLIVDEGHMLKNPATAQCKYMSRLRATNKWVLTGTPLSTSIHELQGYLDFLGLVPPALHPKWVSGSPLSSLHFALSSIMKNLVLRCVRAHFCFCRLVCAC